MIGFISDVHGNHPALLAVLAELDAIDCRVVVSLGDVAGYYSQVNECAHELERRGVINVMGNHDHYLVSGEDCPRSRSASECLRHQRETVSTSARAFLGRSKPFLRIGSISAVHGGWRDPLDEYLYDVDEAYFQGLPGELFASGHTHLPLVKRFSDKTYFNPGSVGQPRDGDPRAAFAVLDGEQVELRRVAYDVEATISAMKDAGFGEYIYQNLRYGMRIGARPART